MDSFDSDDYAYLLENYKRLIKEQDYEIDLKRVEALTIRDAPDVCDPPEVSERTVKFPYLRRGAGLARYGMSTDHFKETPDLYKKKSFKSFTHQKPIKFTKPEKIVRARSAKNGIEAKKIPERKFALTAPKTFDDEVIPALRHRQGESFEVAIPDMFFRRDSPKQINLPKTPIRKLVLNNDDLPEIEKNDGSSSASRRLAFESSSGENEEVISNIPKRIGPDVEAERRNLDCRLIEDNVGKMQTHRSIEEINNIRSKSAIEDVNFRSLDTFLANDDAPRQGRNIGRKADTLAMKANGLDDTQKQVRKVGRDSDRNVLVDNAQDRNKIFRSNGLDDIRKQGEKVGPDSDDEIRVNHRKIAEAMKRKGLTDNVKKHLGWNTTPRKRHPVCIVKKIKVKKSKPKKKEALNIHELKDRLRELEEEKKKFQIENYKMKKMEKNFMDEKMKLEKLRKDLENKIKEEREEVEMEKEKLFEEQKKLKREKVAFDKYCQEARNLPSREERDEIRSLKVEIEKLKNAQKTKEARVGASMAQLRSRIVLLERENKELKEDLEDATKVTLKKVRFESEGRVKSKIIDAINKQLDLKVKEAKPKAVSARDRGVTVTRPLRRTKSAVELKPSLVKTRSRVLSNGAAPIKHQAAESAKDEELEPEVIDLIGDGTSDVGKDSECDSGLGPSSSEEFSVRSAQSEGCSQSVADTYAAIMEMKRRVGCMLGEKDGQSYSNGGQSLSNNDDRTHSNNDGRSYSNNGGQSLSNKDDRQYSQPITNNDGRSYSNGVDRLCFEVPTSGKLDGARHGDATSKSGLHFNTHPQTSLFLSQSITPDTSSSTTSVNSNRTEVKNGVLTCSRHGVAITSLSSSLRLGQNVTLDRNIVRTELRNGDVDEEEIHSGVRRLYCGQCGACETTYRSNPGYRRTTTPDGNTMEEHPDGKRVCRYKSGEIVHEYPYGVKVIVMPNGEREITKPGSKTLERPDGIVRTVYDDGRQETRYPSGRVRIKNRFGHLIMDTGGLAY